MRYSDLIYAEFDDWVKVTRRLPTHSKHSWVNFYANDCYDTKSHISLLYYVGSYWPTIDLDCCCYCYCIGLDTNYDNNGHSFIDQFIAAATINNNTRSPLSTLQLFSLWILMFFSLYLVGMAQNVLQVHRMQHGTQHENIQGL